MKEEKIYQAQDITETFVAHSISPFPTSRQLITNPAAPLFVVLFVSFVNPMWLGRHQDGKVPYPSNPSVATLASSWSTNRRVICTQPTLLFCWWCATCTAISFIDREAPPSLPDLLGCSLTTATAFVTLSLSIAYMVTAIRANYNCSSCMRSASVRAIAIVKRVQICDN